MACKAFPKGLFINAEIEIRQREIYSKNNHLVYKKAALG